MQNGTLASRPGPQFRWEQQFPAIRTARAKLDDMTNPLILCHPKPAGSSRTDHYYLYNPAQPGNFLILDRGSVPLIAAIDDAGERHSIGVQNGWLVTVNPLYGKEEYWAIFARDREIWVDVHAKLYSLTREEISVEFKKFVFLIRINIRIKGGPAVVKWARFPWLRSWFIDGDTSSDECLPFTDIFRELRDSAGRVKWLERWTSGFAVRSSAIKPVVAP